MNDMSKATMNEIEEALRRVQGDDVSQISSRDIDLLIEHERRARANLELGIKPKKAKAEPTKDQAAGIEAFRASLTKAEAPIPRRKF